MFIPLHDANKLRHIRLPFVTLALILVNVVVFLITATPQITNAQQASSIYFSYGFVPAVINDIADLPIELAVLPETMTYVSYSFLHANFMHIAGNMLFLWVFGDNVEDAMGHFKYLIFYLLCAAAGAWAHALAIPESQSPLIGASGATAGVVGAYLLLHPRVKIWILALGRIPIRLQAIWVLGGWIAYQIFSFLTFEDSEVSWAAHLGGILAGMIFILFMRRAGVSLFDQNLPDPAVSVPTVTQQAPEAQKPKLSRDWGRPEDK
jgi:membrane associated rhomboid family serine protease